MMPDDDESLMARPAVASLCRAESGVLARVLAGQAGMHGLHLSMNGHLAADWPHLACLTGLRLVGDQWQGDLRADVAEPLPFVDEAFRVVVLEHVLEWTAHAAPLLEEAARVLAVDGALVVTGFHPFSPWLPWLLCRRRPRPMLTAPGWIRQRLAMHGLDTVQVQRCGAMLPLAHRAPVKPGLGGGFVLVARKRRAVIMSLKPAHRMRQEKKSRPATWVPGTHRECA